MLRSLAVVLALVVAAPLFAQPKKDPPPKKEPTLKIGDPAPALVVDKWLTGTEVKGFEKGTVYVLQILDVGGYMEYDKLLTLSTLAEKHAKRGLTVITVRPPRIAFGREVTEKERTTDYESVATMAKEFSHLFAWDGGKKVRDAYVMTTRTNEGLIQGYRTM